MAGRCRRRTTESEPRCPCGTAYDLERFQNSVRGFYFDFVPDAPGPVVRTSDEVVDAIRRLPELRERYVEAYARFRACYNALEDGCATRRVLEHLGL